MVPPPARAASLMVSSCSRSTAGTGSGTRRTRPSRSAPGGAGASRRCRGSGSCPRRAGRAARRRSRLRRASRGRADVELHEIHPVGPHPPEALLDRGTDVLAAEDVLARPGDDRAGVAIDGASALAGEEVLVAPVGDRSADVFLRRAIVRRGVDEVDAGVEHRVEDPVGLARLDVGAAELHGSVPELGHGLTGPTERRRGNRHAGIFARVRTRAGARPKVRRATGAFRLRVLRSRRVRLRDRPSPGSATCTARAPRAPSRSTSRRRWPRAEPDEPLLRAQRCTGLLVELGERGEVLRRMLALAPSGRRMSSPCTITSPSATYAARAACGCCR